MFSTVYHSWIVSQAEVVIGAHVDYLAAIGKGHGVDRVADVLRGFGLTDFMVEIGGDLYEYGGLHINNDERSDVGDSAKVMLVGFSFP